MGPFSHRLHSLDIPVHLVGLSCLACSGMAITNIPRLLSTSIGFDRTIRWWNNGTRHSGISFVELRGWWYSARWNSLIGATRECHTPYPRKRHIDRASDSRSSPLYFRRWSHLFGHLAVRGHSSTGRWGKQSTNGYATVRGDVSGYATATHSHAAFTSFLEWSGSCWTDWITIIRRHPENSSSLEESVQANYSNPSLLGTNLLRWKSFFGRMLSFTVAYFFYVGIISKTSTR